MNENLEKLVKLARDKKASAFKSTFTSEVNSRLTSKIADMKQVLAKTMFAKSKAISEAPKDVEHTHGDVTHSHDGGDVEHTHDEVEHSHGDVTHSHEAGDAEHTHEGTLPPALKKAIDAKKKGKKDDDEDKEETDENIANFKGKKAKSFKKDKKVDEASGGKEAYQKYFNALLKKFGVKSAAELKGDEKKKFYDEVDAGWEGDNESD